MNITKAIEQALDDAAPASIRRTRSPGPVDRKSAIQDLLDRLAEAAKERAGAAVTVPRSRSADDNNTWSKYALCLLRQLERHAFGLPPFPDDLPPSEEAVLETGEELFFSSPCSASPSVVMHLGTKSAAEHIIKRLLPRNWQPSLTLTDGPRWMQHHRGLRVGSDSDHHLIGGNAWRDKQGHIIGDELLIEDGRVEVQTSVVPDTEDPKKVVDRWNRFVTSFCAWAPYLFPPDVHWTPAFAVKHESASKIGQHHDSKATGPFTIGFGFTIS